MNVYNSFWLSMLKPLTYFKLKKIALHFQGKKEEGCQYHVLIALAYV